MANPLRGEVWLVDLGMVAKIRPCLIFSVPAAGPNDRVLATVVAHTTSEGIRFRSRCSGPISEAGRL